MSAVVKITGATRLYGIVGDPIAQVRSPEVFTERFATLGVGAVLVPIHVPAARFDEIVPALMRIGNLDGLLVTVPFKARMLAFAQHVGRTARTIGAVNALRREADGTWTGDMFDGAGFAQGADRKGLVLRGKRAVLFGAGGAGSAIACALTEGGVASLAIVDPEAGRAQKLVDALHAVFPGSRLSVAERMPDEFDVVINASPVGMQPGDGMPADIGPLPAGTIVGDVVVSEAPTPIIRHAIAHGCPYVAGRDMHAGQVDALVNFLLPPHGARSR